MREKTKGLPVLFESRFVLSESVIDHTKAAAEARFTRVDLLPKGIAPLCFD
jgi:hypothetical protein